MWHITIRLARIWLYTKMRPYGESSNGLAALSPSPFWLGYITNMSGYNFRKGQVQESGHCDCTAKCSLMT